MAAYDLGEREGKESPPPFSSPILFQWTNISAPAVPTGLEENHEGGRKEGKGGRKPRIWFPL